MKEVLYIQQFGDGLLVNGISDTGVKAQAMLLDVRCAVIPPKESYPGYCLFMGMKKQVNAYGKYPLLFLYEAKHNVHSELIQAVSDNSSRLKCSTVYTEFSESTKRNSHGFFKDLWNHRRDKELPFRVVPAVSVKDYEYGRGILSEWFRDKSIQRPITVETIFDDQLKSDNGMTENSDIKSNEWYVFHAIRFILAGYVKNPPQAVTQTTLGLWGDKYDSSNILSNQGNRGRSLSAWT